MKSLLAALLISVSIPALGCGDGKDGPGSWAETPVATPPAEPTVPPADGTALPPVADDPTAIAAGPSLRGDPAFSLATLNSAERTWYDMTLAEIEASRSYISARASTNDLYTQGRTVGNYNAALLMALRATGDLRFLDRVAEISQAARSLLKDAWADGSRDGFIDWQWTYDASSPYYGKDTHPMDEAMTAGAVALVAYAFHVNRNLKPSYAEKADFWRGWLENHFLAKWTVRAGDPVAAWESEDRGFFKRLAHPRARQLQLAYCLWKITGNDFYRQRATAITDQLMTHVQINPYRTSAYRWKHQISGPDEGWQRINYAEYFMGVILALSVDGYALYADPVEMRRYTSTFRDVVLTRYGYPYSSMAYRVDGSGSTGTMVASLSGFARWDTSGTLLRVARTRAPYESGSWSGISLRSYALMAVSDR